MENKKELNIFLDPEQDELADFAFEQDWAHDEEINSINKLESE